MSIKESEIICDNCGVYLGRFKPRLGKNQSGRGICLTEKGFLGFMAQHYHFCSDTCKLMYIKNRKKAGQ